MTNENKKKSVAGHCGMHVANVVLFSLCRTDKQQNPANRKYLCGEDMVDAGLFLMRRGVSSSICKMGGNAPIQVMETSQFSKLGWHDKPAINSDYE